MTRDEIKRLESQLASAKDVVRKKEDHLRKCKIELGNKEFANKGIMPGDKVDVTTKRWLTEEKIVEQAFFMGYECGRWLTSEPKLVRVKKDGSPSKAKFILYCDSEVERADQ